MAEYEEAGNSLRASPHCIYYRLSRFVEEPRSCILRIETDSQHGQLKRFRTSPEFQTFFEAGIPFYNNIEEMHHYEVTHVRGGCYNFSTIERMLLIGKLHTYIKPIVNGFMNLKESREGIVGP
jgi:hypothetical protein